MERDPEPVEERARGSYFDNLLKQEQGCYGVSSDLASHYTFPALALVVVSWTTRDYRSDEQGSRLGRIVFPQLPGHLLSLQGNSRAKNAAFHKVLYGSCWFFRIDYLQSGQSAKIGVLSA
jgi:hypothetical protein